VLQPCPRPSLACPLEFAAHAARLTAAPHSGQFIVHVPSEKVSPNPTPRRGPRPLHLIVHGPGVPRSARPRATRIGRSLCVPWPRPRLRGWPEPQLLADRGRCRVPIAPR
jgi:hypothetical protein